MSPGMDGPAPRQDDDSVRTTTGGRDDVLARLSSALAGRYTIGRELGRGGMATVYLAEDLKHHRQVAVKVLRPELGATLGAERFLREIEVAAGLSHPHVLPLHDSGEAGGLLYYVMSYVEGESLADRLAREGALPVADAARVLREVADALAHAHAHGVVHRDVKPGNILLSDRHAVVTDFGIAKALSAAAADADTLTATGLALGTPAYMAPEQAVGNGHVDHRADLYAFGAVAYEMLAGQPPFGGPSAQAVLAAHVTRAPVPLAALRPAVPAALAALVMRCLEKQPADRPQSAAEVLGQLDAVTASVGAAADANLAPARTGAPTVGHRLRRARLPSILTLYLLASVVVLGAARAAMLALALPDWVLPGAALLLIVGLPIILTTAVVQRAHRGGAPAGVHAAPTARARHWLTWRRAISGGVLAFAAFGLAVGAYVAMRALGIGPVGSLVAAGVVKERERILIADFENRSRDSTLGLAITEAFRIDFAQSPLVRVVPTGAIRGALARMRRPAGTPLDLAVAREVAVREGVSAIVAGEVAPLGRGFVLSAQLVSTDSGEVLAAVRETAADTAALVPAVDRLSKRLRARVGESLKSVRANAPLSVVTTSSFDALRKYTEGRDAMRAGDWARAESLFEEAIVLDTTFAMAYRSLGITLGNVGHARTRQVDAITRAFRFRDRLTDQERYLALAAYYKYVTGERDKEIAAYRALVDLYPGHPSTGAALNNLAVIYQPLRDYARAEHYARRAVELDSAGGGHAAWGNLIEVQVNQGKFDEARTAADRMQEKLPGNRIVVDWRAVVAVATGHHSAAESVLVARRRERREPDLRLAGLALLRGRLADAEREAREWIAAADREGRSYNAVMTATHLAYIEAAIRGRPRRAARLLDSVLAGHPLAGMPATDRPYVLLHLADAFAAAGQPERARALLAEVTAGADPARGPALQLLRHQVLGTVELAEGDFERAIAEFRLSDREGCPICALPGLGRAYDRMGQPDSALAIYERYLATPWFGRVGMAWIGEQYVQLAGPDDRHRAAILRRLGELHEARGDRARAARYYAQFVELWQHCDPELQPQVDDVQVRLARLDGFHDGRN